MSHVGPKKSQYCPKRPLFFIGFPADPPLAEGNGMIHCRDWQWYDPLPLAMDHTIAKNFWQEIIPLPEKFPAMV